MTDPRCLVVAVAVLLGPPTALAGQACGHAEADSVAVADVAAGIIAADNDRDIEAVLAFYAPDAELHPPGEAAVRGRDAIRPRYEALFSGWDPAIRSEVTDVSICGRLAVVTGRNTGGLGSRTGRGTRALDDTFVMVLDRRDGVWLISRLIWHPLGD